MERTENPFGTTIAERYHTALAAYSPAAREEWLIEAYNIARDALSAEIALSDLGEMHAALVRRMAPDCAGDPHWSMAVEEFFLEVISVYDMVYRGYRESVARMQSEIAERRQAEEQLREATEKLARQRDALDDLVRQKTRHLQEKTEQLERTNRLLTDHCREQAEFTYAVSHDLKSPANTVAMMLSELSLGYREHLDADAGDLIDMSIETIERMGRLIVDVLNYSRTIESDFVAVEVDLNDVLAGICADLRSEIAAADASLEADQLPRVIGSEVQLRMLFQNLISNALKFRAPDRAPVIRIAAHGPADDGTEAFSLADNGIGIAPKNHERIFGLFQRLHLHDEYPGSGLGLTLCQRIVGNHGGTITLDSAPGTGSCFHFLLRSARHD